MGQAVAQEEVKEAATAVAPVLVAAVAQAVRVLRAVVAPGRCLPARGVAAAVPPGAAVPQPVADILTAAKDGGSPIPAVQRLKKPA